MVNLLKEMVSGHQGACTSPYSWSTWSQGSRAGAQAHTVGARGLRASGKVPSPYNWSMWSQGIRAGAQACTVGARGFRASGRVHKPIQLEHVVSGH